MNHTLKRTNTQIILDAIKDLHCAEQVVTRETLVALTGLKLSIVDDRTGVLINDGRVLRVRRGVFIPAQNFAPSRAISTTYLPDGLVKLEVGDDCLDLTPREARMLGRALSGHAMEFASIQAGHEAVAARAARTVEERLKHQEGKKQP